MSSLTPVFAGQREAPYNWLSLERGDAITRSAAGVSPRSALFNPGASTTKMEQSAGSSLKSFPRRAVIIGALMSPSRNTNSLVCAGVGSMGRWPISGIIARRQFSLANLFNTPNELPYIISAKEWERLSSEEFWIHALLSESCRFNRELAKAADTKDDTKYQSRGVVNMQSQMSSILPSPHFPCSKYISTSLLAFLMLFSPNSLRRLT